MKKFLTILLAMAMLLSVFGSLAETAVNPDEIEDTMTSADGKYEIAFVTDVGQLKDKSFNQGTWNGVKGYAAANGLSYKYYQPANGDQATDDDRYDAMKAASDAGAKVVVAAGYLQAAALTKVAIDYPGVNFVFIDGWVLTQCCGGCVPGRAMRLLCRLRGREGRLYQAGLLRRWRWYQSCCLPVWLRLRAGREYGCG